jgi:hypothetical protein
MITEAEVGYHATLAVDPSFEGHTDQIALQVIGPRVVHAAEVQGVATVFEAQHRPAMRAAVFKRIQLAVRIARDNHWRAADEGAVNIAWIRQFDFETQIVPVRPAKDRALPVSINGVVLKQRVRHARETAFGPRNAGPARRCDGDDVQAARSIHCELPPASTLLFNGEWQRLRRCTRPSLRVMSKQSGSRISQVRGSPRARPLH